MNAKLYGFSLVLSLALVACGEPDTKAIPAPNFSMPSELRLTATEGETASQVVSIENTDSVPIQITITPGSQWLHVASGTVFLLRPGEIRDLSLAADCGPAGMQTALLKITANTSSSTIPVSLKCNTLDIRPDPFFFPEKTKLIPGSVVTSDPMTVNDINSSSPIAVTGGSLIINGVLSHAPTVRQGDTVAVQVDAPETYSTTSQTVVTIGDISANFKYTTEAAMQISQNAMYFVLPTDGTVIYPYGIIFINKDGYDGKFTIASDCADFATVTLEEIAYNNHLARIGVFAHGAGQCVITVSSRPEETAKIRVVSRYDNSLP